ncbi:hypothetical protein AMTRI_Chr06g178310 [Amborella trichopoda]
MEHTLILTFSIFLATLYAIKIKSSFVNLPPGPRPCQSSSHLSKQYGPNFSLWLGKQFVVAGSSANLTQECFTTNDITFASSPQIAIGKYLGYDYTTAVWAPYGAHCFFPKKKIEMLAYIRQEQVSALLQSGTMKDRITETIFSSIVKMVTNKSYYGCAIEDLKEAKEFREAIEETFLLTGKVKFGDYIPDLKWVDLQGITPLLRALGRKRDRILQQINDNLNQDFIHMFLAMQENDPDYFTDDSIKRIFVVCIFLL